MIDKIALLLPNLLILFALYRLLKIERNNKNDSKNKELKND